MPSQTQKRRPRVDRRTRSARAEQRDTRGELLRAALDVFAERGYRDASVDEIAARAGYSKGAFYWHFATKDDLFFDLLDEAVDRPWRQTIELLGSAEPDRDMGVEATRRFAELLRGQRKLLVVEHEYWAYALRDPRLKRRYAKRQNALRAALATAIRARLDHLGAPATEAEAEAFATAFIALARGLAEERLINEAAVPPNLLGDTFALVYAGHAAARSR